MVDSGAQRSVLAEGAAIGADLQVNNSSKRFHVRFGNGAVSEISKVTDMGNKEVIVDPEGQDSYVAINDLVGGFYRK